MGYGRIGWGRCLRADHRNHGIYNDSIVFGVCGFGRYFEWYKR